jgi:NTE family protein
MGAIIGTAYAAGMSPAELEREALRLSNRRQLMRMADFSLGRALISGRYVRKLFIDKWGLEKSFSELRIPVAVIATDISRKRSVVFTEGSVIDAVMASSAFPGVFPPVEIKQNYFVDGFIFNNVPADVARQLGSEVVLAVDVIPLDADIPGEQDIQQENVGKRAPGISKVLYKAVWMMVAVMSEKNLAAAHTEITLRPHLPSNLSLFLGFVRASEAIAAGERAAEENLEKICQLVGIT